MRNRTVTLDVCIDSRPRNPLPAVTLDEPGRVAGWAPGSQICEMPAETYHAHKDCVSQSHIAALERSPAHYRALLTAPRRPPLPSQRLGTALHARLLEPTRYARDYVVWEGCRRGKSWEAFEKAQAGKEILTAAESAAVQGMARAVLSYADVPLADVLRDGRSELTLFWSDSLTAVRCKARLDSYLDGLILDLKTTDDARPAAFEANAARLGYDVQAAHYLEAVRQCFGPAVAPRFAFIAVETEPPHGVWVHLAGAEFITRGQKRIAQALGTLRQCRASGVWPGYAAAVSELGLPRWINGGRSRPLADESPRPG